MKMKLLFIALLFILAGCETTLTQAEIDSAKYGHPISQNFAASEALNFLLVNIKEIKSPICQWKPLYMGALKDGAIYGGKWFFGYILDGEVKEKNNLGLYGESIPYKFVFYDGKIVAVFSNKFLGQKPYFGRIY